MLQATDSTIKHRLLAERRHLAGLRELSRFAREAIADLEDQIEREGETAVVEFIDHAAVRKRSNPGRGHIATLRVHLWKQERRLATLEGAIGVLEGTIEFLQDLHEREQGREKSDPGIRVGKLRAMTGLSPNGFNKFVERAGVQKPGPGGKNHIYPGSEARRILRHIAQYATSDEVCENARKALENLT